VAAPQLPTPVRSSPHPDLRESDQVSFAAVAVDGTSSRHRTDRGHTLAATALAIARQVTPAETLAEISRCARELLPSCDEVGVTLVRARGRRDDPVTGGPLTTACAALLFDADVGPFAGELDGARLVHVADTATERRWPEFASRAAAAGVGCVLALPLVGARGTVGVLSLLAADAGAFDDDDVQLAAAFATHAGIALGHAELEANLRTGLQTREEIGRAVGILMERHRLTAADAFDMLVVASQHSHRKLRDVAAWMNETGEDPSSLTRPRA
jgi:GAF domain-containing protein